MKIPRRVKWFMANGNPRSPRRARLVTRYFRRLSRNLRDDRDIVARLEGRVILVKAKNA